MQIDILDIPVIYINMDDAVEQDVRVRKLLTDLGFKSITRSSGVPVGKAERFLKIVGVARAHVKAMTLMAPPFLIVEDDIQLVDFKPFLEVPANTDAVFLGNMQWGYGDNGYIDYAETEPVPGHDDLHKVVRMMSTHAIMYLTPTYTAAALATAYEMGYSKMILAHDCYSSKTLYRHHNVVMPGTPMFKQSGKYEAVTNQHILRYKDVNPGFNEFFASAYKNNPAV